METGACSLIAGLSFAAILASRENLNSQGLADCTVHVEMGEGNSSFGIQGAMSRYLSHFCEVQNHRQIEESVKIIVY